MKTHLIIFILAIIVLGCNKDDFPIDERASVEGLSLYWDHEVFGEGGRRLRFEFYENMEYENSFNSSIV